MLLWNMPFGPGAGTARDSSGWQQVVGPNGAAVPVSSSAGYFSASLPLDSISRWNLDQFWHAYQNKALVYTQVSVPTGSTATVTHVYFRPVGYNGLGRTRPTSPALTSWANFLPQGADVVALVLQERDGLLYYGTQRFTVQTSQPVITPTLQPLSVVEIVQRIRQL
jgi:hypothetical protein